MRERYLNLELEEVGFVLYIKPISRSASSPEAINRVEMLTESLLFEEGEEEDKAGPSSS